MNEKHMQYVLTVLKEGSFTGAAKRLYVSQPSLSQIIKAAEANLGAPIFNRNTDPITLFSVKEFERFAFDQRNLRLSRSAPSPPTWPSRSRS